MQMITMHVNLNLCMLDSNNASNELYRQQSRLWNNTQYKLYNMEQGSS